MPTAEVRSRNLLYVEQFDVPIDTSGLWPVPEDGPNPRNDMDLNVLRFYKLGQVLVRRVGELGTSPPSRRRPGARARLDVDLRASRVSTSWHRWAR